MTLHDCIRKTKRVLRTAPLVGFFLQRRSERINRELIESYHKIGPRVAHDACAALEATGIDAWLYAGSLLGAIRDGEFIPWDNDLDLCIVADETFNWNKLEKVLNEAGYNKVREFTCDGNITEQAYAFEESHFDVFAMIPLDAVHARVCIYMDLPSESYSHKNQLSVMYLDTYIPHGKRMVNIGGWELPVPENSEALLDKQYGTSWRTPNPEYKDGTTYTILDGAVGIATLLLK